MDSVYSLEERYHKLLSNIKLVLKGEIIDLENQPIRDYTLKEQIHELGIESSVMKFKPRVQKTVSYKVAAVLFNESMEVLMIQESKRKYSGRWYLPQGKVEPNEQLIDAVKREMEEESGYRFEPSTLLRVESRDGHWYRFTYTGRIVGGQLKTKAQADKESVRARWVADPETYRLRSPDCLRLIDFVRQYVQNPIEFHKPVFTSIKAHKQLLLRMVCVLKKKEKFQVLVSTKESPHLPVCEINPLLSLDQTLDNFILNIFEAKRVPKHNPFRVLSIEHNGRPKHKNDGLCISILVLSPFELTVPHVDYTWLEVEPDVEQLITSKFKEHSTISFDVI